MKATPKEIEAAVRLLGSGLVKHFPASDGAREFIMLELARVGVSKPALDKLVSYYLRDRGEWTSLSDFLGTLEYGGQSEQVPGVEATLKLLEGQKMIEAPTDPEADAKLREDIEALGRRIKLQNAKRAARPVREVDVKTPGVSAMSAEQERDLAAKLSLQQKVDTMPSSFGIGRTLFRGVSKWVRRLQSGELSAIHCRCSEAGRYSERKPFRDRPRISGPHRR